MFTYNFALLFDKTLNEQIINFSDKINRNLNKMFCLQKDSMPHATILKFEVEHKLNNDTLGKIQEIAKNKVVLNFYGLSFLPSKDGGVWVEISILKTDEMIRLQSDVINILPNAKRKNKIFDLFRPHITLSKVHNVNELQVELLDYDLLRRKSITATLGLGLSGKNFEFLTS